MSGFIPTTFHILQHKPPARSQDYSHRRNKTVYVKHNQLATKQRFAPKINSTDTNRVKFINGTFLYYARTVDPTMIPALNNIST